MKYISSNEVLQISNRTIRKIAQGFKIKNDYCKATTELVNYKDIVLTVNAYFLNKDKEGNAECQLEFVIPLNRVLPDFELHTNSSNFMFIIVGIFVLFLCYLLAKTIGLYIGILYIFGFGCVILGLFNAISSFFRRNRMGFSNSEFNKKYSVSGSDLNRIKNFFNGKICDKLVNYDLKHNIIATNNLLILDTFYYSFKEEDLSYNINEFLKEAIDVAIIFNDTGKNEKVSNSNDIELIEKRLFSYFKIKCSEEKAIPF